MKYAQLCDLYETLEQTPKRLRKTRLISTFLKKTPPEELKRVILLLQGRIFPQWDPRTLGVSEKLVIKAISVASGTPEQKINDEWRTRGDLGDVAEQLMTKKTQATLFSKELTVKDVFTNLQKAAAAEGTGSISTKIKLLAHLLSNAKGKEARYLVRTILEDLRIGVAEGTLRDAIAWAYLLREEDINYDETTHTINPPDREHYNNVIATLQAAIDKTNDFTIVALTAQQGINALKQITITPGKPLKVMLAQKVTTITEGFNKVGKPCALEYKYDGFRLQIHKTTTGTITLFTRRLENVTNQFPDVVTAVKKHVKGKTFILDAEAVGYDPSTGKYKPFQEISQRIKRKYEINRLTKELPVELNVFDILYYEGQELLQEPFTKRRTLLENIITPQEKTIMLAKQLITDNEKKAQQFFNESLKAGNEGIMLKKLDAPYQPGSRVGTMIKLKPTLDTFDLAIVGAEWGTGKRSGWLTSFTVACWDEDNEELLTIGKFGTGIKEKKEATTGDDITFEELTKRLKPLITTTKGREVVVKPDVIVEVTFEEIQKSPTYTSGYALRFPRFVKLRDDRGIDDMTTLSMVKEAYERQRGRHTT